MSDKLDAAFAKFHLANPRVWEMYKSLAMKRYAVGYRRGSSEQMIQVIRWEMDLQTFTTDGFKISNNHRKRYALKLATESPEFRTFFEFRPKPDWDKIDRERNGEA